MLSPRLERLIARNAKSTPIIRSDNTRKERTPLWLRVKGDMMPNKLDMEDRPSLSSERRPRPPRRSLLGFNALSVQPGECSSSRDASRLW